MPRKLIITDGPSFRDFVIENGIIARDEQEHVFTMNREVPKGFTSNYTERDKFELTLNMIGRNPKLTNLDKFLFIANRHQKWFYVGLYDVHTRKGHCTEFESHESFTLNVDLRDLLYYS